MAAADVGSSVRSHRKACGAYVRSSTGRYTSAQREEKPLNCTDQSGTRVELSFIHAHLVVEPTEVNVAYITEASKRRRALNASLGREPRDRRTSQWSDMKHG